MARNLGRLLVAAGLSLQLPACTERQPWEFFAAQNGVEWDPQCRRDLSHVTTTVIHLPRDHLVNIYLAVGSGRLRPDQSVNGLYFSGLNLIAIADDLTAWRYADTLHWERCRAWLHETTGSPQFINEVRMGVSG